MIETNSCPAGIDQQLAEIARELQVAVANYCLFHQAAVDRDLLQRLGTGQTSLAFQVVRNSLHQACVMSLMRIWDKDKGALSIERVVNELNRCWSPLAVDARLDECLSLVREARRGEQEICSRLSDTVALPTMR